MRIHRFLSITDLVVALLVLIAIFLPKRAIQATDAYKLDPDERADLAAAQATALAQPDDGAACAAASRKLGEAGALDWAIETARDCTARATAATRWQADLALSDAYAKHTDVQGSYDAAKDALAACTDPAAVCPEWQQLEIELYLGELEAGMKKGIDPRKDPAGFRRAAEDGVDLLDVHGTGDGK